MLCRPAIGGPVNLPVRSPTLAIMETPPVTYSSPLPYDLLGSDEVCARTHVSFRQLHYWMARGWFTPAVPGRGPGSRAGYSDRDLSTLWLISRLVDAGVMPERACRAAAVGVDEALRGRWLVLVGAVTVRTDDPVEHLSGRVAVVVDLTGD